MKIQRGSEKRNEFNIREGDGCKLPALKPMYCCCVDSHGFFCADVRAILEVSVLSLLFSFEVQTCANR